MGVDFSAQYLLRQLGLILAVGLLYLLLFSQYRYGVADNGDYYRVGDSIGVSHLVWDESTLHDSVRWNFARQDRKQTTPSAAALFAQPALLISTLRGEETFSISNLSFLYGLIYLLGLFFLMGSIAKVSTTVLGIPLQLGALLILLSIPFVAYFNSLYQSAAFFPCLLLALSLWLHGELSGPSPGLLYRLQGLVVVLMLFLAALSKLQYSIFILLLVPFLLTRKDRSLTAIALLLVAVLLISGQITLSRYAEDNAFNRLFSGLLWQAPEDTQLEILSRLSLGQHLDKVGTGYWPDGVKLEEEQRAEIANNASALAIGKMYLLYPERLYHNLVRSLQLIRAAPLQIHYLAYNNGMLLPWVDTLFTAWGRWYPRLFPYLYIVPLIAIFTAANTTISIYLAAQLALCILSPVVVLIGDGFWEFNKHLVGMHFATSYLFLVSLVVMVARLGNQSEGDKDHRAAYPANTQRSSLSLSPIWRASLVRRAFSASASAW